MRILITRPAEDGAKTAARLAAMGHQGMVAPLLVPHYDDMPPSGLTGAQAILITSANGVRALGQWIRRLAAATPQGRESQKEIFAIPVFAVGPQTTAMALSAGFADVRNADGDVHALARCAAGWAAPDKGALVHICSRQAPGTLVTLLGEAGFAVRRAPLYRIEAATELPRAVLAALGEGQLDAAMFFSPRSAAIFRDCLLRHDGALATPLTGICISAAAAAALAPLTFAELRIAERPNQDSMLALVE